MLLADILARDAQSIMVDAYDTKIEAAGLSALVTGRDQNAVVNQQILEQRRFNIEDIPGEALQRILEFSYMEKQSSIRLVNKRFATLALPYAFHTIYIKSADGLQDLISASFSPLYFERLGKHVRLFELGFLAHDHHLKGLHHDIPFALPNLETVRLRFTFGIPTDTGEDVQNLLSEDTIYRAILPTSGSSWLQFLALFQPKKFEWISNKPQNLHLLGVYRDLRSVFQSWKSLTSIYLEGICLVEQSHLSTWTLALLAERMHIRGLPISDEFFLGGLVSVRHATPCQLLLLEALKPEEGSQFIHQESTTPVIAFGTVMVSLKGWSARSRLLFLERLTKHSLQRPAEVGPQLLDIFVCLVGLVRRYRLHIILGIFIGVFFAIIKDLHTPTPRMGLPYSTRSLYPIATRDSKDYIPDSYNCDKASLSSVRLFGFTWPPLDLALRSSNANDRLLSTFVPT